jgi:ElaA protein
VVEQACIFQDADDKDQEAWHYMAWLDNKLVAYTRLLAPGASYEEASIGRVITSQAVRRTGIGKTLMQHSIEWIYSLFGNGPIQIGAQLYLKKFYESFGFKQTGEVYLEDGIEHIHMIKP